MLCGLLCVPIFDMLLGGTLASPSSARDLDARDEIHRCPARRLARLIKLLVEMAKSHLMHV